MAQQLEPIARMVAQLSRLPGIGHKSAQRLAYHIISMPLEEVRELATAVYQGRKEIRYCDVCGNYATDSLCDICANAITAKSAWCATLVTWLLLSACAISGAPITYCMAHYPLWKV